MYPRMALQLNTSPRSYGFYKKFLSGPRPRCAPRMRRQCHSVLTPFLAQRTVHHGNPGGDWRESHRVVLHWLLHQQLSGPVMEGLREWLKEQIEQRLVEPNSGVGAAIEYMRRHWTKLTLFL